MAEALAGKSRQLTLPVTAFPSATSFCCAGEETSSASWLPSRFSLCLPLLFALCLDRSPFLVLPSFFLCRTSSPFMVAFLNHKDFLKNKVRNNEVTKGDIGWVRNRKPFGILSIPLTWRQTTTYFQNPRCSADPNSSTLFTFNFTEHQINLPFCNCISLPRPMFMLEYLLCTLAPTPRTPRRMRTVLHTAWILDSPALPLQVMKTEEPSRIQTFSGFDL